MSGCILFGIPLKFMLMYSSCQHCAVRIEKGHIVVWMAISNIDSIVCSLNIFLTIVSSNFFAFSVTVHVHVKCRSPDVLRWIGVGIRRAGSC